MDARIGAWNWPPATLLGGLSRPARERMAALGTLVQYPAPGRVLMREGEPTNFVLLLDGALDELLPTVCHITEQFADNPVEAGDHSATAVSIRR